jgi:hypothetical protein
MKINNKLSVFFLIALYFNVSLLFSQVFKRIESQAGLSILHGNIGVSVADYDGDNDLDLFVVSKSKDIENNETTHSKLFRNNNDGTYTDVTEKAGLSNLHPFEENHLKDLKNVIPGGYTEYKWGASWGDFDNDGDPDLFFTNTYRVLLFQNNGDSTFTDITTKAGIKSVNKCFNTTALWFDYDKDGYLDLFIGDYASGCGKNSLYKNNGNGTFADSSELLNPLKTGKRESFFTFMALPIDINHDGWMDLYLANDFGRNDLYINVNGTKFIEQSKAYGLDNYETGMALSVGDYDNNGSFDIYLSNVGKNNLFTQNPNTTFSDKAEEQGVVLGAWAWASRFADFDLDKDEDLILVNGDERGFNYNIYFKNLLCEGEPYFKDESLSTNFRELTYSMGTEVFDYDNDGDLDVFVTNRNRESFFYKNTTINGTKKSNFHWLKIKLQGTTSTRDAVGAKISIVTNSGTFYRYHHGSSLYGQSFQPVHFGTGTDTDIKELKITWPSGIIDSYKDLKVDQTILATENKGFETINISPSIVISGCTDPNSCSYNPLAILNDNSCTYLPTKAIEGTINSTFLNTETYSYPLDNGASIKWAVEGGEITNGQNNKTITVKWGIESTGKITVTETNNHCSSSPLELIVNLKEGNLLVNENLSVARLWNEALLDAIRKDYARPTVHARNLFHTSIAMYDAWAIYDLRATPYLIGNNVHGFNSVLKDFKPLEEIEISRNKAISYAVYRVLCHRFKDSPNSENTKERFDLLMNTLGYDTTHTATNYTNGDAADLGNYIAETIINYGFLDGSRESTGYDNAYYQPVNAPLIPTNHGNKTISDPNRWQPLSLNLFIDQSGNVISETITAFLNPEWGNVSPFSLQTDVKTDFQRNGNTFSVYHDPGSPPYLDLNANSSESDNYKWGNSLVSIWGSHLDPTDNVLWDISPSSIGNININSFPKKFDEFSNFYNTIAGGDIGKGHSINPVTNTPYQSQIVPRGDYTRVLAEFWADGPDSETPPGHWFALLNYVNDHPLFEKKLGGNGAILEALEWDVKAYFIMGGTMHDAAISAWGIKGWYDYTRPISAIRYLAELGQSSDSTKSNYNIAGIPLKAGYIETVEQGDPLEGRKKENLGKIKLFTWKGHNFISDTNIDQAGVGWILAEDWWPYQRPSFVTPPFAGYVSGHSTYSRAAAEVMTLLTGDAYFPGGYGEFIARKNEFLVFEEGPSMDIKLQWATYRDASDQCSLSRIWGGIHPPADDIPGRFIGEKIGIDAFNFAIPHFYSKNNKKDINIYPNPAVEFILVSPTEQSDEISLLDIKGNKIQIENTAYNSAMKQTRIKLPTSISTGIYIVKVNNKSRKVIVFKE